MRTVLDESLLNKLLQEHKLYHLFDKSNLKDFGLYEFEKGETICSAGDQLDKLYFLVKGKVKIFSSLPNGKSLLLRFNKPLSIIGEVEFVTKRNAINTVESVSESLFIGISFSCLNDYYETNPQFLQFIIQQLSYRLFTSSTASSLNLLTPVENRFASYLLSIYIAEENSFVEEIKTSKLTETAELLGTSYRHLNRVISNLSKKEIIEKKNGRVMIKDIEKLEAIAGGNIYE